MSKFVCINLLVMDLQTRKINFVQEFLKLQNEELILRLEALLKKESKSGVVPMSIEEYNGRIDKSLDDSKNGRMTGTDDLLGEIEGWE